MRTLPTLFALGLITSCASSRASLGEIALRPVHLQQPSLPGHDRAVFRVERGRLTLAGSGSGADFDVTLDPQGCLRGSVGPELVSFCPTGKDQDGAARYRSIDAHAGGFSVSWTDFDARRLRIDNGVVAIDLTLPRTPAGNELRQHPALLGAALMAGVLPPSQDPRDGWEFEADAP